MPTLLIDGTTSPYANSTDATAAIAAQAPTGCMFEGSVAPDTRTVFTSSFSSNTLICTSEQTVAFGLGLFNAITSRVQLSATDGISVDFVVGATYHFANSGGCYLYEDDETTLVSSNTSTNFASYAGNLSPTIATDGFYRLYTVMICTNGGSLTSSITLTATGGTTLTACPVDAAYGGTPDYIACV